MASVNSPLLSNAIRNDVPAINAIIKALAKADPSILSDLESGTKRFYEGTNGWEFQELVSGSWVTRTKFNIDAQSVDGYNTSVDAVASTIVVRDTSGKLKGNLTGKADTAGTADKLASTLAVNAGGTGATIAADARTNLGVPPTNHASTATTYGIGTGSNYGHVKLSDATNSTSAASAGVAASPKAVSTAKSEAVSEAKTDAASQVSALETMLRALIAEELAKKLDRAGGALWGTGGTYFYRQDATGLTCIRGGIQWDSGAQITLYGKDNANSKGDLTLRGTDGTNAALLVLGGDGSFKANGNALLTSAGGELSGKLTIASDRVLDSSSPNGLYIVSEHDKTSGQVSHLALFPLDFSITSRQGSFDLCTGNGTSGEGKIFRGLPSGALTWDGHPVITLVDSWDDGAGNWYRKWSDGWIEQGGKCTSGSTVSLPTPFTDDKYSLVTTANTGDGYITTFFSKSATQFTTRAQLHSGETSTSITLYWYACGY